MNIFEQIDTVASSTPGVLADIGASFYADHLLDKAYTDAGITSYKFTREGSDARNRYKKGKHGIRKGLNKYSGGIVKGTSTRGSQIGVDRGKLSFARQIKSGAITDAQLLKRFGASTDVAKLRSSIGNALRFKNVAGIATGAWLFTTGMGIVKGMGDSVRQHGASIMAKKLGFGDVEFSDTNRAFTSRQRAMRAIQNSQSGHRRALGNEASFIRSYA